MLRCARRKHDNGPRFELPPGAGGGASDVEEDAGGASLSLSSVGWPLGSPLVGLAEAARIEAIISDTEVQCTHRRETNTQLGPWPKESRAQGERQGTCHIPSRVDVSGQKFGCGEFATAHMFREGEVNRSRRLCCWRRRLSAVRYLDVLRCRCWAVSLPWIPRGDGHG